MKKINKPFDVSYEISFSGRSISNGKKFITSQIVRDKILNFLEEMIDSGTINEYSISAMRNNIKIAKETIKRNRKG